MQIYDSSTFIKSLEYVIKGKSIDFLTYDNNFTRDYYNINMMKDQEEFAHFRFYATQYFLSKYCFEKVIKILLQTTRNCGLRCTQMENDGNKRRQP